MGRPLAIEDYTNMCFKCLQKKSITTYSIAYRGYGSSFDSFNSDLQLCNDCTPENINLWFNENPTMDGYCERYKYEEKLSEFLNTLPLEGKELFWARYSDEACADYIDGQDWIDYELGILPHEKCKEYGWYSPQEKEAYHKRFSICDKVKFIIYKDNSKGCHCPFGAFGNNDGTSKGHQTQSGCYKCKMFKIRENEIETITREDFDIYELENKLALKIMLKELRSKNKD